MDLAHQYHRPPYPSRNNEAEAEDLQQKQQIACPTPYYFEHDRPRTPLQGGSLGGLSANLFSHAATSKSSANTVKDEEALRVHNDEMQRAFDNDQDFRRQLGQAESWQGDWVSRKKRERRRSNRLTLIMSFSKQLANAALGPPLTCSPQQENIDQMAKQSVSNFISLGLR